jgi:hypothetical protein
LFDEIQHNEGHSGYENMTGCPHPQRTTNHGQATGKLYYLRLRVECIFFVIYQAGANPRFILLFSFDFLLQSGGAVVAVIAILK